MGKDPAFLFYPGDAAEDVSHMNRLERGAYFDFVQAQKKFGPMPLITVQKILGKDFESVWDALKMCLTYEKDMYFIHWLQESIEKRKKYSASRSKNRKGENQAENKDFEKTYVNHMGNGNGIVIESINTVSDWQKWGELILKGNDPGWEAMRGRVISEQEMDSFLSVATRNEWSMETQHSFRVALKGFKDTNTKTLTKKARYGLGNH